MNTNIIYKKIEELNECLVNEDFEVRHEKAYKGNTEKDCLVLLSNKSNVHPVIYLTKEMLDTDACKLADNLKTIFVHEARNINVQEYLTTDYVLGRVLPRIVSNSNIKHLEKYNIPYIPYLDLVIYFGMPINEMPDENLSIRITNSLLTKLNLTLNEIQAAALRNIESNYQILNITQILSEFGETEVDFNVSIWVLTNKLVIHGAAAILSQKPLKEMEKHLGKKYVILPSSIHEVICIPYTDELEASVHLVRSINQDHVKPDEVLSNSIYIYDNGEIRLFS